MKTTNCYIGIKEPDDMVQFVYCCTGSHVWLNGKILFNYYETPEKVYRLISGGTIEEIDHNGNKDEFEYNLFTYVKYSPDKNKYYMNIIDYNLQIDDINIYLFDSSKWYFNGVEITRELLNNEHKKLLDQM